MSFRGSDVSDYLHQSRALNDFAAIGQSDSPSSSSHFSNHQADIMKPEVRSHDKIECVDESVPVKRIEDISEHKQRHVSEYVRIVEEVSNVNSANTSNSESPQKKLKGKSLMVMVSTILNNDEGKVRDFRVHCKLFASKQRSARQYFSALQSMFSIENLQVLRSPLLHAVSQQQPERSLQLNTLFDELLKKKEESQFEFSSENVSNLPSPSEEVVKHDDSAVDIEYVEDRSKNFDGLSDTRKVGDVVPTCERSIERKYQDTLKEVRKEEEEEEEVEEKEEVEEAVEEVVKDVEEEEAVEEEVEDGEKESTLRQRREKKEQMQNYNDGNAIKTLQKRVYSTLQCDKSKYKIFQSHGRMLLSNKISATDYVSNFMRSDFILFIYVFIFYFLFILENMLIILFKQSVQE